MLALIIIIGMIIGMVLTIIGVQIIRDKAYLQDLAQLRFNALEICRLELRAHNEEKGVLCKKLDNVLDVLQRFLVTHQKLQEREETIRARLVKAQTINGDLTSELAKVLTENSDLQDEITKLKGQLKDLEEFRRENIELRINNRAMVIKNQKLMERNHELEYAINLESISMIESYQERGKLFNAIDDVRRSLTRVLNPV
ncbi:MAG: hypothetical protein ACTSQ8_08410 [Candidatus Helarchaeota archaeon]